MHRWPKVLLALVVVAVVGCAGLRWCQSTRDHSRTYLARKGRLIETQREVHTTGSRTTVYNLVLVSDKGLRANARLRAPNRDGKFMGVLLAAGLETGMRVIDLVEERDDLVVLAVDYGWQGEFDITTLPKLWRTVSLVRAKSADTVPCLLLGLDALAEEPSVDRERIVVVGVSYGSYYALPAAALEPRVSRLILVQGGGELGAVITANARLWRPPLPPRLVGWIGENLFASYRPERWIGQIAPRPVTFIASRTDPGFPVPAVERVFARAGEPKELVWHDTHHVAPEAAEIIAELSRVVLAQLGTGAPQ